MHAGGHNIHNIREAEAIVPCSRFHHKSDAFSCEIFKIFQKWSGSSPFSLYYAFLQKDSSHSYSACMSSKTRTLMWHWQVIFPPTRCIIWEGVFTVWNSCVFPLLKWCSWQNTQKPQGIDNEGIHLGNTWNNGFALGKNATEQTSHYYAALCVTAFPVICVFNLATGNRLFFCFTSDFGLPLIFQSVTKAHFVAFGAQVSLRCPAKDIWKISIMTTFLRCNVNLFRKRN